MTDIRIKFIGSYCNSWPEIEILANGNIIWKDRIIETKTAEFSIEEGANFIIRYINKRFGPEVYDTRLDQEGNIIEDQFVKIESIFVNGSDVSSLIESLIYVKDNGESLSSMGYLAFNGYCVISIPTNINEWIIGLNTEYKNQFIKEKGSSSESYYVDQVSENVRRETLEILDQLEEKVNRLL